MLVMTRKDGQITDLIDRATGEIILSIHVRNMPEGTVKMAFSGDPERRIRILRREVRVAEANEKNETNENDGNERSGKNES